MMASVNLGGRRRSEFCVVADVVSVAMSGVNSSGFLGAAPSTWFMRLSGLPFAAGSSLYVRVLPPKLTPHCSREALSAARAGVVAATAEIAMAMSTSASAALFIILSPGALCHVALAHSVMALNLVLSAAGSIYGMH